MLKNIKRVEIADWKIVKSISGTKRLSIRLKVFNKKGQHAFKRVNTFATAHFGGKN